MQFGVLRRVVAIGRAGDSDCGFDADVSQIKRADRRLNVFRRNSFGQDFGSCDGFEIGKDRVEKMQERPILLVFGNRHHNVFFPELWRVRNELTALSQQDS